MVEYDPTTPKNHLLVTLKAYDTLIRCRKVIGAMVQGSAIKKNMLIWYHIRRELNYKYKEIWSKIKNFWTERDCEWIHENADVEKTPKKYNPKK